jgi:hypothetical protein
MSVYSLPGKNAGAEVVIFPGGGIGFWLLIIALSLGVRQQDEWLPIIRIVVPNPAAFFISPCRGATVMLDLLSPEGSDQARAKYRPNCRGTGALLHRFEGAGGTSTGVGPWGSRAMDPRQSFFASPTR